MDALQLQLKQKAVIEFNQDQLEKYLLETEEKYSGIIVTEDNLSEIGKIRAKIGKLKTEIHSRFNDVKKQALEPISGLEVSVRDAKQRIETLYRSIKDQEDAYEVKRRESVYSHLEKIRLQIIADNHINDDYQHLVEIKDSYLNKTADESKILDELAEQASNAYIVQKAAFDALKLKEQKQKMIAEFCVLYSDKYELKKPLQSISFNGLIESDVEHIQVDIEKIALEQKEKEEKQELKYTAETKENEQKQQDIKTINKQTDYENVNEDNEKTMDIRITATSHQRIALTRFFNESSIKFEVLTKEKEA